MFTTLCLGRNISRLGELINQTLDSQYYRPICGAQPDMIELLGFVTLALHYLLGVICRFELPQRHPSLVLETKAYDYFRYYIYQGFFSSF